MKRLLLQLVFLLFPVQVALAGSNYIGLRVSEIPDPQIQRSIEVAYWYPTEQNSKPEQIGPLRLDVSLNAEPQNTDSLIIISHGFSGSMFGHNYLAQYLAKNGYFVITPTHPDIPGLKSGRAELDPLVLRPRHIDLILSHILKDKSNITSIGIIGYSLGAYTALLGMGARPDFNNLNDYCSSQSNDALLCASQARQRLAKVEKQLKSVQDKVTKFKAAVLLAPGYGPLFTGDSFDQISIPIRMFSAENDEELDGKYHADYLTSLLGSSVKHESINSAGHYTFMAPCSEHLKKILPPFICIDKKGVDRLAIHQDLNIKIHEFFKEVL